MTLRRWRQDPDDNEIEMMEYDEAMQLFYSSQTFDKLTDTETGLYLESSAYVYGIFQDETNFEKSMAAALAYLFQL